MNPTVGVAAFHAKVVKDLDIGVSRSFVYRAKVKALKRIKGDAEDQYAKV